VVYVIQTPNKGFSGDRYGVPFRRGIGRVEERSVRDYLCDYLGYYDVTPEAADVVLPKVTHPGLPGPKQPK
jgi:hypothetical protein